LIQRHPSFSSELATIPELRKHRLRRIYLTTAVQNLLNLSTDTTLFPWARRTPTDGLRATIAVALALLIGKFAGHPAAGAIAAAAAYSVGFAVFHEALASTLLSMGLLTLGIASATLAGSLCAQWTWAVLLLAVVAAINYALLSDLSATAGWIGQQCAVYVVVASYFSQGLHYAVGRTSMVLAGGALQMLVFTVFHFLRHRAAEADAPPLTKRLRLRVAQLVTRLRDQLHPSHATASYTLRLAITLLLCTAIYRHYHVRNGYWSPMTGLLVLKPQWTSTLSRGIARFLGTLVGAGIAFLIALYIPLTTPVVFVLIIVFAWASIALQAVNYAAFSLFVTLYIVCLFHFGGFSEASAAHIRLFNTALGGAIALLVDATGKLIARQTASSRSSTSANFVQ
jgi:Fusaric acid resistance protein-like